MQFQSSSLEPKLSFLDIHRTSMMVSGRCKAVYNVYLTPEESLECIDGLLDIASEAKKFVRSTISSMEYENTLLMKSFGVCFTPVGSSGAVLNYSNEAIDNIIAEKTGKLLKMTLREYVNRIKNASQEQKQIIYNNSPVELQESVRMLIDINQKAIELGIIGGDFGNPLDGIVYMRNYELDPKLLSEKAH